MLRRIAGCLGAGTLAVVLQQGVLWLAAVLGAGRFFGSALTGDFSISAIAPRLAWGGWFALLFLLPLPRAPWWLRGLLFSLAPTLHWLWQTIGSPFAWPGAVGSSAFAGVLCANVLWGLAAAWLLESAG